MGVRQRLKERMSRYSPGRFRDEYEYAKFFDWRAATFAGQDMMTLEYPDRETQARMFRHALAPLDLAGRTVLDVGCGLGYLEGYLDEHHPEHGSYLGIDLSTRMVDGARQRWGDHFARRDVIRDRFPEASFDYVTLISVLGYKVTDDPHSHMTSLLTELFRVSRVGIAFTHLAPGRRARELRSDFTVPPEEMAAWCRDHLSPHVTLDDTLELVTYAVAVMHEPPTTAE